MTKEKIKRIKEDIKYIKLDIKDCEELKTQYEKNHKDLIKLLNKKEKELNNGK